MKKILKRALIFMLAVFPTPKHPTYDFVGPHLRWRKGWLKGWVLRPYWGLKHALGLGPSLTFGKRFSLLGTLRFSGNGRVIFGDDVIVDAICTPFTHRSNAVIQIGSRCFLNGTRFGCSSSIAVGNDCILADARIMDTDFHALHKNRNLQGAIAAEKPIFIGNNVWVSAGVAILKGVTIGDDSVIGYGAVLTKNVPHGRIFGGNPAQDIAPIPEA